MTYGAPTDLGTADILRARDLLANRIVNEIINEGGSGTRVFEDALRHHIVLFLQRLRVCLFVIDKLMTAYNTSVEQNQSASAA